MKDTFSTYHPIVNFVWFAAVLFFAMFIMHPVFLTIALVSSFTYSVVLNGRKAIRFNLLYMLPFLIFMALINPAFNHAGATILFYLKNGNPITLESILYGVAAAVMFVSIILWFSCYNAVMTSDKFVYLFGRIIPALSLILSMVLRFVPRYKAQLKVISNAQKCIGRDISKGNLIERAKNGVRILSIMTTWALENSIETADSMRARGYGLSGRTSFSIFQFESRDKIMLIILICSITLIAAGAFTGQIYMSFFPEIKLPEVTAFGFLVYVDYLILCLLPIIIDASEEMKWKSIRSKI